MSTMADWTRDIVAAAEERGWAVVLIDARASLIVLEEPVGSYGLTIRIAGRALNGDVVRTMPEPGSWIPMPPVRVRSMPDGSPCWCVSDHEPQAGEGWLHSPTCEVFRRGAGIVDG